MPHGLGADELKDLYETFGPAILRRARALLRRDADAWDAMQEVFERLLRSGASFRGDARPMTYVYRVTTNVCLNVLRGRAVREAAPQVSPHAPEGDTVEVVNLLRALSDQLDERAREVAVLHFLDELTQEEIAEVLGVSRKTIQRDLEAIREKARALGEPGSVGHG